MMRLVATSLCLLTFTFSVSEANEYTADSKIKAAVVYNDRATITRQAIIELPAGSHTVFFKDLPALLYPDSLRADGSAATPVKFGAVVYKLIPAAQLASPRAEELLQKLEVLQDQQKLIEGEKQALAAKKLFLTNLGVQAGLRANEDIAEINLKPEQWATAAQTLYSGLNETTTTEIQLDAKNRSLGLEIAKLQAELNELNTNHYSSYSVNVPLELNAPTTLTLNLSYQVKNAGWRPIYDARLETGTSKLELVQYGSVRQNTGEDWDGITLSLSTAQPQRGTSLPDLNPYWVDLLYPNETRGIKELTPVMQEAMEDYNDQRIQNAVKEGGSVMPVPIEPPKTFLQVPADASGKEDPLQRWRLMQEERLRAQREKENVKFSGAAIETGGFVSEYKIPGPASVTSDGTESKLMVGTFSVEGKIQVHIKPQQSTDAYLVSKATLKGENPILPGAVSLFRDGAYVGQSSVPLLRPEEEHVFFFGTDDQVSVKRKVLKDEKSDAKLLLSDNVQERNIITEIQNLHKEAVQIVVKETIPTGRNEKIQTDILKDKTTPDYELDSANIKGLLRWDFMLEPKAKQDLKLGWKVSWPKDTSLSGL